jgi:hypothetical protein
MVEMREEPFSANENVGGLDDRSLPACQVVRGDAHADDGYWWGHWWILHSF